MKTILQPLFAAFLMLWVPLFSFSQTTDTYSTPGTVTWVVPACVTSITVRAWGGGGAGGGARTTDRNGGGGGGGAFCTVTEPVTPGETIRITVGAGGTGVSAGTGNAGGFSQVEHLTGPVVFCRAAGGNGGQMGSSSSTAGAGGAGGAIANNIPANTGFRGGNGGSSDPNTSSADVSGGGGGGAGTSAIGLNGGTPGAGTGGASGGGNGGAGVSTTSSGGANGNPGLNLGGGGGGSTVFSSGTRAGANGARGEVTITWTANGCGGPTTTENFTTPGSFSWVVPACVTSVSVEAWGGGGGGGGTIAIMSTSNGSEACTGAGGGGGGGYSAGTFAVTPGQTYTVVVGAGGIAGAPGAGTSGGGISTAPSPGGLGGTSSFSGFAINLQATGGTGGGGAGAYNNNNAADVNAIGAAGTGGTGLGGSVSHTGGNGAPGHILNFSTDKSGAGGGAAGPGGNGGNAPLGSSYGIIDNNVGGTGDAPGGNGGTSRMNNLPSNTTKNGGDGSVIGAGGGGALNHKDGFGVITATGGAGARGEVRLTYAGCAVLPFTLSSFDGYCDGNSKIIHWTTASEQDNQNFTLEHSLNGRDFEPAKIVAAAGNSVGNRSYSVNISEKSEYQYYRLAQTDNNGTITVWKTLYLECDENESGFTVFPNPAEEELIIQVNNPSDDTRTVVIQDLWGREVHRESSVSNQSGEIRIALDNLAAGSYFIGVWSNDMTKKIGWEKFVKK